MELAVGYDPTICGYKTAALPLSHASIWYLVGESNPCCRDENPVS